jgi:pimeloyl-ACP methyl ester carboxylesterase
VGRHAQYLAENIPGAELWLPEGVRHNVHMERPDEWLERVVGFLKRRGKT